LPHKSFLAMIAIAGGLAAAVAPSAEATVGSGDQLYVTNGALADDAVDPTVARFGINPAGLLTHEQTVPAGKSARGMVFTPRPDAAGQRFAFIASWDTDDVGSIDRYRVATDGTLIPLGPEEVRGSFGIAIHPDGRTLYVSQFDIGTISAFRIGLGGKLTKFSQADSPTAHPKSVAITPDGRFLYVTHGAPTDPPPGVLAGFAVNPDGSLQPEPVARQSLGANGSAVAITPDGRYVYASSMERGDTRDLYGFRIGAAGDLTAVPDSPFQAGEWVEGAAINLAGTRLYTAALTGLGRESGRDGEITGYTIDPASGRLQHVETLKFGFDPIALAFGRDGKALYVADFADPTINVFQVDSGGDLTHVQSLPSGGANPGTQSVTVQPATVP
jgi:6-phosphogluconolactonase